MRSNFADRSPRGSPLRQKNRVRSGHFHFPTTALALHPNIVTSSSRCSSDCTRALSTQEMVWVWQFVKRSLNDMEDEFGSNPNWVTAQLSDSRFPQQQPIELI